MPIRKRRGLSDLLSLRVRGEVGIEFGGVVALSESDELGGSVRVSTRSEALCEYDEYL